MKKAAVSEVKCFVLLCYLCMRCVSKPMISLKINFARFEFYNLRQAMPSKTSSRIFKLAVIKASWGSLAIVFTSCLAYTI